MIAALRAEVAGEVADAAGLDGVRALLATLFVRFMLVNVNEGGFTQPLWLAVEDGQPGAINVGGWLLLPVPREEWIGELDGYWRSILRPMPLPMNEQPSTLAGSQLG